MKKCEFCWPNTKINTHVDCYVLLSVTVETGESPRRLQEVDLTAFSDSTCDRLLGSRNFIQSTMVCAGELEGGKDTCQVSCSRPIDFVLEHRLWQKV